MAEKIPDKVRINLELPGKLKERIDHVKELSEAESVSEVLRWSLAVYEYLWSEKSKSSEIVIRKKNGKETVLELLPMVLQK
ncbi:hypothetical protein [Gimesia sp.]|uniref:hypothetical protein n=1 Tax=Gimesia sp. TaxID=2024833 RepID=UPI000C4F088C|nr:hypothetical protein [Gimesia sp.]MAX40975.1 hypothetical protein [Gimesia sp.]HAH46845.1 hypothetical protein [Planctomycetaceae bacterium]HBL42744.1 hypothetical protein [Planctomycetaceae bacterium]|tara:strand:+ start:3783 stop:4025 length:243 start_codon:yes stop_codon:yes gene_type:complete